MDERQVQLVLLVRALEEVDREGIVLSLEARDVATNRATRITGMAGKSWEDPRARDMRTWETVLRRANFLYEALGRKLPALVSILSRARHGAGLTETMVVATLALGLLCSFLGPPGRIDVLALPLWSLVAWNLAVFVGMSLRAALRLVSGRSPTGVEDESLGAWRAGMLGGTRLATLYLRAVLARGQRAWKSVRGVPPVESRLVSETLMRFAAMWHRLAAPLIVSRIRRMLHLGALFLALGLVLGLYIRGFALDHPATFESRVLGLEAARALSRTVLAPAAATLGMAIPDLAAIRGPQHRGPAAVWLHLHGVSVLGFVILPRLALTLFEAWRVGQRSSRVPLDLHDGYFRRVLARWRGAKRYLEIVPYHVRLDARAMAALKMMLHDFVGSLAVLRARDPLPLGAAATRALPAGAGQESTAADESRRDMLQVLVFDLAREPERAIHGEFLEQLRALIDARGGRLLVLVDPSALLDRRATEPEIAERLAAWERVIAAAGLRLVELRGSSDELLERVRGAVWPRPAA